MKKKILQSTKNIGRSILILIVTCLFFSNGNAQTVLDNSKLRFGTGFQNSVNTTGNLEQPFYYNATQAQWRKLTYSTYPLDNAFAIGGVKTNEWNINGTIVQNPVLLNQIIDLSGYISTGPNTGYGTIISTGNVDIAGQLMEVRNTYVLPQNNAYITVTTRLRNISATLMENVRIWIGTRDDWVGATDGPRKQRGNLSNGTFTQNTNPATRATTIQITSGSEGVLFYTNSTRGNTAVQSCCSFGNVINQDPATSVIDVTSDGSYGFYVRMNDLAIGDVDAFTWYYAAGELADLPNIVNQVAVAGSISNITYTTADFKATSPENATGYYLVVPSGSATPTPAEIKNGANYGAVTVSAAGSGAMTANVERTFNVTGLSAGTAYVLHFVSQNSALVYSSQLAVPFTTLAYSAPTVSTTAASLITATTAVSGGNVSQDGGQAVTARGVCWNTSGTPTIANSLTSDGIGTGVYSSTLTGLMPATTYFVRAYATNTEGTSYGNQISFTTLVGSTATATISGTTSVCQNSVPAPRILFSGANGSGPYTFTYNVNGGAPQTVTTVTNDTVSIAAAITSAGIYTYNLTTVSDINGSQAQTGSATVTVTQATVHNLTQMTDYCSIQSAVNAANNGDAITVDAGTFNEQVIVNKSVSITGAGASNSIITYTGTVTGKATLFDVSKKDVTISGFTMNVDMTKLSSAIIAQSPTDQNLDNLSITNNVINATGSSAAASSGTYGNRNAISINYAALRVNPTSIKNLFVNNNTITATANDGFGINRFFRAGIATDEGSGIVSNNSIYSGNQDIQFRFTSNGSITITGNTLLGGGVNVTSQNPSGGAVLINNNTFTGPAPDPNVPVLRLQNNNSNFPTTVSGNNFTGYARSLGLENYRGATVNNNTFTPVAGATDFIHLQVNTKLVSTASSTNMNDPLTGTFTNNKFNGSGTPGGIGLGFYDHKNDPSVPLGSFTIGTPGNENEFANSLSYFVKLDNQIGSSNGITEPQPYNAIIGTNPGSITTMACWYTDQDIRMNKFDVGSGLQVPAMMNAAQKVVLENKLFDKIDASCAGRLIAYNPVHNLTTSVDYPTIQSAVDAASPNDVLLADAGTYPEQVTVNKSIRILGANAGVAGNGTRGMETVVDGQGVRDGFIILSSGVTIDGFKIQGAASTYGTAYYTSPSTSNDSLNNSIITDNVIGAVPNSNGVSVIYHNLFTANNRTGAAGGAGIYVDGATNGLKVIDNEFTGHLNNSAVNFAATHSATHINLLFTQNYIHDNNDGNTMLYVMGSDGGTFSFNDITQNSTNIKLASANNNNSVLNNNFTTSATAFRVNDENGLAGTNTGNQAHFNNFTNSNIAINNELAPVVNATCNAYGSTVPATVALKIVGGSTYIPYLINNTDASPAVGFQTNEVCDVCATTGIDYAGSPYCKADTNGVVTYVMPVGDYTGGTFTSTPVGLSINASTGKINAFASNAGTYIVTYSKSFTNGCASINANDTITIYPLTDATITGASNTQVCAGQSVSVNVNFNGAPQFSGSFNVAVLSGAGTPSTVAFSGRPVGVSAITVPSSSLTNTSSSNVVYRISFNNVTDGNNCPADPQTGFVDITVNPLPVIAVSAASAADVCPGTNITFNVTETNNVGGNFNWVARDSATGQTLGMAANVAYGPNAVNTNLGLSCPVNSTVIFSFRPVGPAVLNCLGDSLTRTVHVRDTVKPIITFIPADTTVACSADIPAATPNSVTATDNCLTTFRVTSSDSIVAGSCTNKYIVYRTYTVTDNCNNFSTQTQVITVNDTIAPVITVIPANVTVACASAVPAPNNGAVTASDNCSGAVFITNSDSTVAGSCSNRFIVYRKYTATDSCGNASSMTQVITVNDTIAPVITVIPANVTVACASAVPAPNNSAVTASDNCSGAVFITNSDSTVAGSCSNRFIVYRKYTATDSCGNFSSMTQVITVNDTIAPVITVIPANVTVACASAVPAPNNSAVTASDNCSGAVFITNSDSTVAGSCSNRFIVYRKYTATDSCGNFSSMTQVITVNDTIAPVITVIPANVTVACASAVPAPNNSAVTASDNCSGAVFITNSDSTVAGSCSNRFIVYRKYTATDSCGNASSMTQIITVNDTIAPVITVIPANVTVACASAVPAPNNGAVTASDNCSGAVFITNSDSTVAGSCSNRFIVYRKYTATDSCGNASSMTQVITVNDTIAPVITVIPANVTVACASAVPAPNNGAVTASDNCSGAVFITNSDSTVAGSCSNRFIVYRKYTATDSCGNASSMTQIITVNDTIAPVITVIPANVTVACASAVPAPNNGAVTASDNCSGAVFITNSDSTVAGSCSNRFIVYRKYTATDSCGNFSSMTQIITVNDTIAPVITVIPANVTVACASAVPAPNNGAVTASDNCSGAVFITNSDSTVAGSCSNRFIVYRKYTATDSCGNASSMTQIITVNDTIAPVITVIPANVTVACASAVPAPNNGAVTASDNCSGAVFITNSDSTVAGSCSNRFIVYRKYTATDSCGNASSMTQIITVNDTIAPVITVIPANVTVACASAVPAPNNGAVTASDNCSGAVFITNSDSTVAGSCANRFIVYRKYTATDSCGNASSMTQVITVNDTIAPVITCPATINFVQCGSAIPAPYASVAAFTTAGGSASDNCGGAMTISSSDSTVAGSCVNKFTVYRTYSISDVCGNTSMCTQMIIVNDTTRPTLSTVPPQTLNVGTGANCTVQMPDYRSLVTASDNCGGMVTLQQLAPNAPGSLVIGFGGTRTVEIVGTDVCGNRDTTRFILNIVDSTPPLAQCKPITVFLNAAGNVSITPSQVDNGSADNCTATTLVSVTPNSFTCANVGPNTVTLVVMDANGNRDSCTTTVTVRDTIAPVISCFGDTTLYKAANCTNTIPDLTFRVNTADACGIQSVTQNIPAGTIISASVPSVVMTLTVTDNNNNSSTCSFTVFFNDSTRPVIVNCPADVTVSTGPNRTTCDQVASWTPPTATDNCSVNGAPVVFSNFTPGSTFPVGVTQIKYWAKDVAGNTSDTCRFTVTVLDNTVPVITCPASIVDVTDAGVCTSSQSFVATATDNCGVQSISYAIGGTSITSPYNFPVGVTTVTSTATDVNGNTNTCSFTVTITDTIKPVITCPSNIVGVTNAGVCTSAQSFAATATDNCTVQSITYAIGGTSITSPYNFPVGVTTVTSTATDVNGNSSTCSFTVTITDTIKPVITCPSNIVGVANAGVCTSAQSFAATATDNCTVQSITYAIGGTAITSPYNFPVGVTTVTSTATDVNGNSSTCSFTVTITDTIRPVIVGCPSNVTVQTGPGNTTCTQTATWTAPTATDNCSSGSSLELFSNFNPGDTFPLGTTQVKYWAKDASGNVSDTCRFNVTVVDNTAPVFTFCPSNLTNQPANAAGCTAVLTPAFPSYNDACGGTPSLTYVITGATTASGTGPVMNQTFNVGTSTVTYTATDSAGNSSTCEFTVQVVNTLAGNITGTTTVAQNSSTTSNITFSATGGTAPYTFTYNVNGGSNQTVSTTGSNTIVTVPQSNAVLGQFIYTLVSVTGTNGCIGTIPADNKDTITVVSTLPRPDFAGSIPRPLNSSFTPAQVKEGYVQVNDVSPNPSTGQVVFRISIPSNFTLNIPPTMTTAAGTAVNNNSWTITPGAFFFTIRSTGTFNGNTNIKIGYTLTSTGSSNTSGTMNLTIISGTGGSTGANGDNNDSNNNIIKTFTIQ